MLDIFKGDAFSVMSLTDAINSIPFVPGQAGRIIQWNEQGVATLSVAIESKDGVLQLINPSPRGGPGNVTDKRKRTMRQLVIPHYEIDDAIYADEVQGIRAFGQESQVETVLAKVNDRMADHVQLELDPTLEYQRVGAIKGIILNADNSTLYNLFTEFGVSQEAEVNFDFDAASPASGAVRKTCAAITRTIADNLGGVPFTGVSAFVGRDFFDALVANQETRETFLNQTEASQLRTGYAFQTFDYGGIHFEEYRGAVGGTPFIADGEARFFPVGVPGLFRTVYAPADYVETVNTIGLPRYTKQFPMPNDKGINMEMQSNALSYCTRPKVLMKGIAESA